MVQRVAAGKATIQTLWLAYSRQAHVDNPALVPSDGLKTIYMAQLYKKLRLVDLDLKEFVELMYVALGGDRVRSHNAITFVYSEIGFGVCV